MRHILFSIMTVFLLSNLSCTRKDASTTPQESAAVTDTAGKLVQIKDGVACPNGEPAGYLRGTCPGRWNFVPGTGGKKGNCAFEWGPAVTCPEGTKAVGYEAVCYGVSGKELTGSESVSSSADCEKAFGSHPSDPKYELVCCKGAAKPAAPAGTGG